MKSLIKFLVVGMLLTFSYLAVAPMNVSAASEGAGYYIVNSSDGFLTVRSGPSSASKEMGRLINLTIIHIDSISTENKNYGEFIFNGKKAYVSLNLADKVSFSVERFTNDTNDPDGVNIRPRPQDDPIRKLPNKESVLVDLKYKNIVQGWIPGKYVDKNGVVTVGYVFCNLLSDEAPASQPSNSYPEKFEDYHGYPMIYDVEGSAVSINQYDELVLKIFTSTTVTYVEILTETGELVIRLTEYEEYGVESKMFYFRKEILEAGTGSRCLRIVANDADTFDYTFTVNSTNIDLSSKLGQRLANFQSNAYKADNVSYNSGYNGQCVWYIVGRAVEKTGILFTTAPDAKLWLNMKMPSGAKVVNDNSKVRSNAIAVRTTGEHGHVLFIESVYDGYVYYTEANVPRDNKVSADDGILKRSKIDDFIQGITGYIYLN